MQKIFKIVEVLEVFDLVTDQFAGSQSSATIVVEVFPDYAISTEIRDVRDLDAKVREYAGKESRALLRSNKWGERR